MSILLNHTDNIQRYAQLYQQLADEYHRVFYNSTVTGYADGCQTANILSLELPNVVPQSLRPTVVNSLVNSLNDVGHFTGGIISVAALFPLLSRETHHDLALKLALSTTYPSYGYMFNNDIQNATTTWEEWDSLPRQAWSSFNHHMFNTIGAWFYRYLAGIELNALKTITIHPRMSYAVDLLNYTEAEVVTLKGPVQVQWTRLSVESMILLVTIPNNLDANVLFDPLIKHGRCMKLICDNEIVWVRENQNDEPRLITNVRGISDLSENPATGVLSLRATSGKYMFMTYWQ
jgi:alpha-L-rhamnosidase